MLVRICQNTLLGVAVIGLGSAAIAPAALAVNPQDISIVGNLQAQTDLKTPSPLNDRLYMNELELAYQGYLSPYSRADVLLGVHPDDDDPSKVALEPEEIFVSLLDLPLGSALRIGKFKASFGKLNRFHPEQWFSVDQPLVLNRLLGEDGLQDFGAELSLRVPNPWDTFVQINAAVLNGAGAAALPGADAMGKAGSFRVSSSVDLGEDSYLEAGLSGLAGQATHSAGVGFNVVGAADVTCRWRPDETTSFTATGEYLAHQRQLEDGNTALPTGFYVLANYQFLKNHDLGFRVDQTWNIDPADRVEQSGSVFYAFAPWEFNRYRIQASHTLAYDQGFTSAPAGETRLLGQMLFALGPHKHAVTF